MAKPIIIKVDVANGRIYFWSDFIYRELNEAIKPGRWDTSLPMGPGRTKPGAWNYPATLEVALSIHKHFNGIVKRDPDSFVDPEFYKLVQSSQEENNLVIKITDEGIVLTMPFNPEYLGVIKSVEGWEFRKGLPRIIYPFTRATVERIASQFEIHAWDLWQEAVIDPRFTALVPDPTAGRPEILSKTVPWQHQKRAFWRAYDKAGFMLALDMGTGKSKVAIDLAANWKAHRVLVVCPKAVVNVWPEQFNIHADIDYGPIILTLGGKETVNEKTRQLNYQLNHNGNQPIIVIVNYDIIYRQPLRDVILKAGFDLVIADESHKFKSPGGVISKFMAHLGRHVPRRLALTGTPMPQTPFDVYAQMRFVDPRCFETNYAEFTAQYASSFDDYGKPRGYKNLAQLNGRFYQFAERVKSSDVLDLPPTLHIEHYFDLPEKTQKIYKDLENRFEAEWESGSVNINNVLTQILRLQQITGGHIKNDETAILERIDNSKSELLKELLTDLPEDEPVVIFCRFKADMNAVQELCAELDRETCELSGRDNELALWQEGRTPVLIIQIQSGGAGVDLTRSCHCFYYSVGYSLSDYEQSLKRTDRPGQTRPVRYYHLLANGTIDIKIQKALAQRKKIVDMVLDFHKTEGEPILTNI